MDVLFRLDLLISSVTLLWTTGLTEGNDVNQPPMLWKKEGENVTIECSHTKGSSFYQMYWYRQLPGETMRQIVYSTPNGNPEFEQGFTDAKFAVQQRVYDRGTLTVKNLEPGDKGWYFCAVSEHSDTEQKSLILITQYRKNMVIIFLTIHFNTMLVSGSSLSDQVLQTPAEMYRKLEETAIIKCSHSIDSYNRIFWYKQSDRQLQLLGYLFAGSGKTEDGVNVRIEGDASKDQTCTLTVEGLTQSSSAVYFCAATIHIPCRNVTS
ncbi:uncharacterized protein [Antennarius striatus]|uniref:uncharacterized protein n=1 Tax=Antennarius striatus TaxID=241820 RepID=UPI0035B2B4DE